MDAERSGQIVRLIVGLMLLGGVVWYVGRTHPVTPGVASIDDTLRTGRLGCGPAALLAVVGVHDVEIASQLRGMLQSDGLLNRPVSSFYDLATWARRVGFRPLGLKVDARQLARLPLPAIVHVSPDHFLALMEVNEERVVVVDQGPVMREIPRVDFDRRFGGYVLCVQAANAPFKHRS